MLLTLDIGNTQIFAGVFANDELLLRFRKTSKDIFSSDELGLFLRLILRENDIALSDIKDVAIASVVPDVSRTAAVACARYFGKEPFFVRPGIKTGLKINTAYGQKLGADRLADIAAAQQLFPEQNLLVIDFGTANTYDALSKDKEYKGGAITPGLGTGLKALCQHTALLPKVEIIRPEKAAALSTETQMQSGLYYGQLGEIKEFIYRFKREVFAGEPFRIVATGGFARMFEEAGVFDVYEPDLVLCGIKTLWQYNQMPRGKKATPSAHKEKVCAR